MRSSVAALAALTPRANAEVPLKATLRKAENGDVAMGGALDTARIALGWSLDRLAIELSQSAQKLRDPRQVSRWLRGEEHLPVHLVWQVPALQRPFALALCQLAGGVVSTRVEWPEARIA